MNEEASLHLEQNVVRTTIDLKTHRLLAVKKAAYRMADRFTAVLGAITDDTLPVSFTFKPGTTEAAALEAVRAYFQELLDQDLREQIAEETAPLRTLVLAHAFSRTSLIGRE